MRSPLNQHLTQGKILRERRPAASARGHAVHAPHSKRARGGDRNERLPYAPPEDWYEPTEECDGYRFVIQPAGRGYRHVVTESEVRARLDSLPANFVEPLEVVQFSRLTRKKRSFPCYGMQWGSTVYLYPIEDDLVEYYGQPPKPNQVNESRMYGGRWIEQRGGGWKLVWTEQTIKDFYLNNILIHELGHLLDERNTRPADRERFAEWFAVHHGYRPSRQGPPRSKGVRRRHHRRTA